MSIDDNTRHEKMQYDIKTKASKISAFSSVKNDEYEYLTCEETLSFDQRGVIEQATFTYSLLGKALEKQRKPIEDQEVTQFKAIKALNLEEVLKALQPEGN